MGSFLSQPSDPSIPAGPDLRIVLIGKTGVGKSAVGNTVLGKIAFRSVLSANSVTARCDKQSITWCGRKISVVDTPGIVDTHAKAEDITREIVRCIQFSSPGPHALVIILQPNRFTDEEKNCVNALQKLFGEKADQYMIVLFTRGDDMKRANKSIQEFVRQSPAGLQEVVRRCGNRFHVLDNISGDRNQVVELIKKIDAMVAVNGNSCYTNEMYQEAEGCIQQEQEKQRVSREEAEKKEYAFSFLAKLKDLAIRFLEALAI